MTPSLAEQKLQLKETGVANGCGALLLLAKPGIVIAVAITGFVSMIAAGRQLPEIKESASCVLCLLLMSAGSAMTNNVLDRRPDLLMDRLCARSAALRLVGAPTTILVALLLTSSAVIFAARQLNIKVAALLVAAAFTYTVYYTLLLKPYTPLAAILGALPGAFPVLIGHVAVRQQVDAASIVLFLIMLLWQPPHFWLLALQYQDQYRAAQVPVLPVVKGEKTTKLCIYLGIGSLSPAMVILWHMGRYSAGFLVSALFLAVYYLFACHYFLTGRINYRAAFRCSVVYLMLFFMLIVAEFTLAGR